MEWESARPGPDGKRREAGVARVARVAGKGLGRVARCR